LFQASVSLLVRGAFAIVASKTFHVSGYGRRTTKPHPYIAKTNANSRVNNCELGILANVKLPATSEYPTLSTKYYVYELLWNSRFELNDEWRKWVAVAFCRWPFVRIPIDL